MRKSFVFIGFFALLILSTTLIALADDPPRPRDLTGPRIVGGQEADPGEWPWQVALIASSSGSDNYFFAQFCGGSLIDLDYVLTAAHCISDSNDDIVSPTSLDVVAGVHDLWDPETGHQRRDVAQIIRHPGWDKDTFDNDLAVLRLSSPVTLGPTAGGTKIDIVSLTPPGTGSLTGVDATTTGWGALSYGGGYPTSLREVVVPILSNATCENWLDGTYGNYDWVTINMICAGYPQGGKDACQGDSGGPLVYPMPAWKLAGIVSWGIGCAAPTSPGVYTRVSQYINWLDPYVYEYPNEVFLPVLVK